MCMTSLHFRKVRVIPTSRRHRQILMRIATVEQFGSLSLPLSGTNGYTRVRGGQGRGRDKFQGYTVGKARVTSLYDTAHEAAVALAALEKEISLGFDAVLEKKPRAKRGSLAPGLSFSLARRARRASALTAICLPCVPRFAHRQEVQVDHNGVAVKLAVCSRLRENVEYTDIN